MASPMARGPRRRRCRARGDALGRPLGAAASKMHGAADRARAATSTIIGVPPGTLACRGAALAASARRDPQRSIVAAARAARRASSAVLTGADIVTRTSSASLVGRQGADRVLADRGRSACAMSASRSPSWSRPTAICAEDALELIEVDYRAAAGDVATRRCAETPTCAGAASRRSAATSSSERVVPLWRSRGRVRRGRASRAVSTSTIRAIPARRSRPTGVVADYDPGEDAYDILADLPGPVQHPRGAGARAEGARQPAAAAHAAGLRRQLRRQAGRSFPTSC